MPNRFHFGAAAVVALAATLFAQPAMATTISFAVPPANVGVQYQNTSVDLFSSGLNGTVLSGQSLSLDLDLAGDLLARISLPAAGELGVSLTIFTNAGTEPGFAGATTGFLFNPAGGQLGDSQVAGRSQSSDGSFSVALVSFSTAGLGGANTIDISGAHFDTAFPNSGFLVTDARLRFTLGSNGLLFGTPQQLPETSTLFLTLAGVGFGVLLTHKRVAAGR